MSLQVPSGTQLMNQIGLETLRAIQQHTQHRTNHKNPKTSKTVFSHSTQSSHLSSSLQIPQLTLPFKTTLTWKSIESFLEKRGLKENTRLVQSIFEYIINHQQNKQSNNDDNDNDDGQGWGWIMEHPECMEEYKQVKCQCPFLHESQRQQLLASPSLYASHPWAIFHYLSDWKISSAVVQALSFNLQSNIIIHKWSQWPTYGLREQIMVVITLDDVNDNILRPSLTNTLNELEKKDPEKKNYTIVFESVKHYRKAWLSLQRDEKLNKWVRHGLHVTWYENTNQIRSCFCYQNGQRYGLGQRWNPNGTYSHYTHFLSEWPEIDVKDEKWKENEEDPISLDENTVVTKTSIDINDSELEQEVQWVQDQDTSRETPIIVINKRLISGGIKMIESKESWKLTPETYEPSSCLLYEYYPITERIRRISSWKCLSSNNTCLRHGHEETFHEDGTTKSAAGWMLDERIY